MSDEDVALTPDMLLAAYRNGYFPMALDKDDPELYWFCPEERGVLPIAGFNIPRGLQRSMKKQPYTVTVDTAFEDVIRACGTLTPTRHETWINENIVRLYTALFNQGDAHSIEVWQDTSNLGEPAMSPRSGVQALSADKAGTNKKLVGGLYGVSIGGAFFGESMFSRATDASKIALVTLVEILAEAGYLLLDTQYVNDHLKQFGVEAVAKRSYMTKLEKALKASPNPSIFFSTVSVRKGAASSSSESST